MNRKGREGKDYFVFIPKNLSGSSDISEAKMHHVIDIYILIIMYIRKVIKVNETRNRPKSMTKISKKIKKKWTTLLL